jgi:hypothetical protein
MDFVLAVTSSQVALLSAEDQVQLNTCYQQFLIDKTQVQALFECVYRCNLIDATLYLYQNYDVTLSINQLTSNGNRTTLIDSLSNNKSLRIIDSALTENDCWKYLNYAIRYSTYDPKTQTYTYNKKYSHIDLIQKLSL